MDTIRITCACGHPTNVSKKALEKYGADNPAAIVCKDDGHKMKYTGTELGECLSGQIEHKEKPQTETPKAEAPKAETPKAETPKAEAPKTDTAKTDASQANTPKLEAPAKKSSNWFLRWLRDEDKGCTDKNNDGKLSFTEGLKFFAKGFFGGAIKNMINNPISTIVGAVALSGITLLTGGAALPWLLGIGIGTGAIQMAVAFGKVKASKDDATTQSALESMGTGLFTIAASTLALKAFKNAKTKYIDNTRTEAAKTMRLGKSKTSRNAASQIQNRAAEDLRLHQEYNLKYNTDNVLKYRTLSKGTGPKSDFSVLRNALDNNVKFQKLATKTLGKEVTSKTLKSLTDKEIQTLLSTLTKFKQPAAQKIVGNIGKGFQWASNKKNQITPDSKLGKSLGRLARIKPKSWDKFDVRLISETPTTNFSASTSLLAFADTSTKPILSIQEAFATN